MFLIRLAHSIGSAPTFDLEPKKQAPVRRLFSFLQLIGSAGRSSMFGEHPVEELPCPGHAGVLKDHLGRVIFHDGTVFHENDTV